MPAPPVEPRSWGQVMLVLLVFGFVLYRFVRAWRNEGQGKRSVLDEINGE